MDNKTNSKTFEIKKITDDAVIYQRVFSSNSKKNKRSQDRLASSPTATLHTISLDEYEHLKAIEVELLDELKFRKPQQNKIKKAFLSFFELE
ncbi:hypothetical protein K1F50_06805 [Muricauda oceani]|uniref:Uncharacterized protein n=1 Tax=Flagellimonas oceani TaxID=2698672 RepID=A0A6G7J640_9FLAO|nr:hypothetical protein [Allomuricauda oceani]MBW8242506.1 hypothetical protein [Allomuricauda oceani]QII46266.1 hypothetical protein GVT53_16790 [Allomuricauda oceani]